ncbi:MAG: type II secretion system GspH family protein [Phycisphaerae bacterium]|nr:type II secretion system GspH family protein [Phycisphaerae bacterium]
MITLPFAKPGNFYRRRSRKPLHGFTLIELLVVIAIISLLASILLPSLRRAKEFAKRTVCLSQQRGVILAQGNYANDNKRKIKIGYYSSHIVANYYVKAHGNFVLHGVLHEQGYLADPESLYCPSTKTTGGFAYDHHEPGTWNHNPWDGLAPRASLAPRPASSATSNFWPPRQTEFANKAICADVCGIWVYVTYTHTDGVNVGYGDGSGRWVNGDLFLPLLHEIYDGGNPRGDPRIYDVWTDVFDM